MFGKWFRRILIALLGLIIIGAGAIFIILQFFVSVNNPFTQGSGNLNQISLPDGFEIEIFAENIDGARSMRLGENGTLFISSRAPGNLYAIPDATNGGREVITFASGLTSPNGIAIVDDDLYVAEISRISRYDDIENTLDSPQSVVIQDNLPENGWHGWRYLAYAPDGMLYVAIGAPCNVCEITDKFGTISRMNLDGSNFEVYATGIRNSVGFDWHPETDELWFTSNGRDLMGDDIPPDTLNHAPEQGLHFGFPYCHAGDISDPEFGEERDCDEFTPPARNLSPHGASLGMRFYTGEMFPEDYHNQIFIAEHGSWNRSIPIGYRIMLARLDDNGSIISYEPFAEGWLNEETGQAWGRPVDILIMPDGSLLISDDAGDVIYRISYTD